MRYDITKIERKKNYNKELLIKAPNSNRGIEKDLLSYLVFMIDQVIKRYKNQITRTMSKKQQDSFADTTFFLNENFYTIFKKQANEISRQVSAQFTYKKIKEDVRKLFERVDKGNKDAFYKRINNAMGIDIESVVKTEGLQSYIAASMDSTSLRIKNLSQEISDELSEALLWDMQNGKSLEDLTRTVQSITQKTKGQSKVIASSNINAFSAGINKKRALNVGITEAYWQTSEDAAVRDSHRKLNGKKFYLGKGLRNPDYPTVGSAREFIEPGEDYGCRCIPIFIINPN